MRFAIKKKTDSILFRGLTNEGEVGRNEMCVAFSSSNAPQRYLLRRLKLRNYFSPETMQLVTSIPMLKVSSFQHV